MESGLASIGLSIISMANTFVLTSIHVYDDVCAEDDEMHDRVESSGVW